MTIATAATMKNTSCCQRRAESAGAQPQAKQAA
jgi:hypothetical protein